MRKKLDSVQIFKIYFYLLLTLPFVLSVLLIFGLLHLLRIEIQIIIELFLDFLLPLGFLALAIYMLVLPKIIKNLNHRYFYPILFQDLDPVRYRDMWLHDKWLPHNSIFFETQTAIYAGDYQTAVDLASCTLQKKLPSSKKNRFLYLLSVIYFEQSNKEQLQLICNQLNEQEFPVISFYQHFIDGNYEACLDYLAKLPKINPTDFNAPLLTQANTFSLAVVHFHLGNYEEAKDLFEEVVRTGPKMHKATIAKQYLAKIKAGDNTAPTFPEVLPDPNFKGYKSEIIRRIKKQRIIWNFLILLNGVILPGDVILIDFLLSFFI